MSILGTSLATHLLMSHLNDKIADLLRKHGGKTGQEFKAEGN